jgi:sugar-specific transcriptional regulator TrmB
LLSTLEAKGIVTVSIQRPTNFSAVKIEQAIESIINNQQEKIEELKILKHDMIELWNSFQNIRQNNRSDISKLENRMKKYAKFSREKTDFKRKLKEMRRKSDMLDN